MKSDYREKENLFTENGQKKILLRVNSLNFSGVSSFIFSYNISLF